MITTDYVIALYSNENARELFYLSKVVKVTIANEKIHDSYDHCIEKKYKVPIVCNYFEKVKEKRGFIQYKLLIGDVFVHPCQVAVPSVDMSE